MASSSNAWAKARWLLLLLATGFCWSATALVGRAHVEADPNNEYAVTPTDGVWMICAASYVGEPAKQLAHTLVIEIRQRYDLPAFVFNRGDVERRQQQEEFDREAEQQRKLLQQLGADPNTPIRHRMVNIVDQCAVLIGGYKDMDTARRELDRIRRLDPPRSVPVDKIMKYDQQGKNVGETADNPFVHSFVVRNPTVPMEPKSEASDPIIKPLNAGERYSLLGCKHPWTLLVKEYDAPVVITPNDTSLNPSFWEKIKNVVISDKGSQLNAAAVNARNLAEVLRKMGFEAYVLHTRHSSYVSVGAFDSQNDPRMLSVRDALDRGVKVDVGDVKQAGAVDRQKVMAQLQLLNPPLPMMVPRP
jgi:hypothetical protein